MSKALAVNGRGGDVDVIDDEVLWRVVASGDLKQLTAAQKAKYYLHLCQTTGLNPATQPFEYMVLNGKEILYTRKGATDQLRQLHGVSIVGKPIITDDGEYITAEVTVADRDGRTDFEIGVVFAGSVKGADRANYRMKALTKGKRRATLSLCGLGTLDETEVETMHGVQVRPMPPPAPRAIAATSDRAETIDIETGEIVEADTSHPAHEEARQKAMARLHALGTERGLDHDDLHHLACARFGVASLKDLDTAQIAILNGWVLAYDAEGLATITYYARWIFNAPTYVALQKIGAELKGAGIDDEGLREAFRQRQREVKQTQPDTAPMLALTEPEREPEGEAGRDRFTG